MQAFHAAVGELEAETRTLALRLMTEVHELRARARTFTASVGVCQACLSGEETFPFGADGGPRVLLCGDCHGQVDLEARAKGYEQCTRDVLATLDAIDTEIDEKRRADPGGENLYVGALIALERATEILTKVEHVGAAAKAAA